MRIPPFDNSNPFGDMNSRFRLQARHQVEPFRHGQTPQAAQEEQWVEALDRQARLEFMPDSYVLVNHMLLQGYEPEEVCRRLRVDMTELRAAQAWLREAPPFPPGGSLDVTA